MNRQAQQHERIAGGLSAATTRSGQHAARHAAAARRISRRGFTLIEAALVTVIVGVGILALVELLAAGTMSNVQSTQLTTGVNLANNVRELTQGLKFAEADDSTNWGLETGETKFTVDDLDDLDGQFFQPPIDARRASLGDAFADWRQEVRVEAVDPDNLRLVMGHVGLRPHQRPVSRVTVTVKHKTRTVTEISWLVTFVPQ